MVEASRVGGLKASRSIPISHFRFAELPIWKFLLYHETGSGAYTLKNNTVWQIFSSLLLSSLELSDTQIYEP